MSWQRHPPWCGCGECNPSEKTCQACGHIDFHNEMVGLDGIWCCNRTSRLQAMSWPICEDCELYADPDGAELSDSHLCLRCAEDRLTATERRAA